MFPLRHLDDFPLCLIVSEIETRGPKLLRSPACSFRPRSDGDDLNSRSSAGASTSRTALLQRELRNRLIKEIHDRGKVPKKVRADSLDQHAAYLGSRSQESNRKDWRRPLH